MPTARSTASSSRREPPRRKARFGRRFAAAFAILAILGLPFGALAWAAKDGEGTIPNGILVGGVRLGGMDRHEAIERLSQQLGVPANRAVTVTVDGGDTYRLSGRAARVRLNIRQAVNRAIARGEHGNFLARGWREISGNKLTGSEPVRVSVNQAAIDRFVNRITTENAVAAQDASLSISVDSISTVEGKDGRQLSDPEGLKREIAQAFKTQGADRTLAASTETVPAGGATVDPNGTIVTVSKAETMVRVFVGGQVVKTYQVAVGSPEYPTPLGTFTVQSMQVDPPWNVPNSEWAGDLAGKTIPGGDPANPLKARWIGFDGSVGFHGTADIASLGSAASHGCVRMNPDDVKDLYERVQVGTTVYVA